MLEIWVSIRHFLIVALATSMHPVDNTFIERQIVVAYCVVVAWKFLYLTCHVKHFSQNLKFDIYWWMEQFESCSVIFLACSQKGSNL